MRRLSQIFILYKQQQGWTLSILVASLPNLEAVQLAGVQRGHELGEGDETVLVAVVSRSAPHQNSEKEVEQDLRGDQPYGQQEACKEPPNAPSTAIERSIENGLMILKARAVAAGATMKANIELRVAAK